MKFYKNTFLAHIPDLLIFLLYVALKGTTEVQQIVEVVYGRKYVAYIEWAQGKKINGRTVQVDFTPSKVVINRLKLDKDHKKILEHKHKSHLVGKEKGKSKEDTIEKIQE